MKSILALLFVACCASATGQTKVSGTFTNSKYSPTLKLTFNSDSTFSYWSNIGPYARSTSIFKEKGHWTAKGDTIILNPALEKKLLSGYQFAEQAQHPMKDSIWLTVERITNYYDRDGRLMSADTGRVSQFDLAINKNSRQNRHLVSGRPNARCAFAGYIPKEIITDARTVLVPKPAGRLEKLFVACAEFGGTREFLISNAQADQLTLQIFDNRYQDGQLRQVKYLVKNEDAIFIKQKADGKFQRMACTWMNW